MSNFADAYRYARDRYADIGVDTEAAIAKLDAVPISLHCWQGDGACGQASRRRRGASIGPESPRGR